MHGPSPGPASQGHEADPWQTPGMDGLARSRIGRFRRGAAAWMLPIALVVGCGSSGSSGPATSGVPAATGPDASPTATASSSPSASGTAVSGESGSIALALRAYDVPAGTHPHDVSPAPDGGVWYTGQRNGVLGHLDPATGDVREIPLGDGSAPHGVISGPNGAAWITDGGLNAIVRVDPATDQVTTWQLPADRGGANLNTAVFDADGTLWFTGQSGVYGRLDPASGAMDVFDDPEGRGPYGIAATPAGDVWYASLGGSHIARVDASSGAATIVEPPTAAQGARRIWSDSRGRLWVSEWDAGQVALHDPGTGAWQEWPLPGDAPMAYAVFVDDRDIVWLTDFGANTIVRFDPATETFASVALSSPGASVRQLHGRPGEVWGAESAADRIVVVTGG